MMDEDGRRTLLMPALVLGAVQLVLVLGWVRPGPLSIDEVHYLWMVRGLLEGHGLGLPNGYEAFPSLELTLGFSYTTGGRITSQYPYGFPFLSLPFYAVFGFLGLFVANALAFVGVLLLTWKIGLRLLGDATAALLGCAILAVGSFAWEYSMAGWPHMVALLPALGAFWFLLDGLDAPALPDAPARRDAPGRPDPQGAPGTARGRGLRSAALAGLLVGVATTMRLDAVFLLAALGLPFLVARPTRWRSLGGLALGFLPAAVFLGVTNWLRWGNAWPLSYGRPTELERYAPLVAVGAIVLGAIWVVSRPRAWRWVRRRPWTLAGALAGLALLALALPPTRRLALRAGEGFYALLVDLRGQAAGREDYVRREWALIYRSGLKKAFLQSCPWLPLALLPFLGRRPSPERARALALLALVPVVFVSVFAFFRWHGGMALNLRYFLPALPFLALLAGAGIRRVAEAGNVRWGWWLAGGVALAVGAWLVLRPPLVPRPAAPVVLDAPLFLALAVAVGVLVVARTGLGRSPAAPALLLAAGLALGWAGALGTDYDARWSRSVRSQNLLYTLEVTRHVEDGDLVHLYLFDVWGAIKEFRPGVVLAFPRMDDYGDFRDLTFQVLDRGGSVFAALAPEDWAYLRSRGLLEGLEVRSVEEEPFPLAEIRREEG